MKARTHTLALLAIATSVVVMLVAEPARADLGPTLATARERKAILEERDLSLGDLHGIDRLDIGPVVRVTTGGGSGSREKNPMIAFLMSAAVPGLGELYVGNVNRARAFMAVEAGIWLGYGAFKIQENMREDDYREYASIFAGVDEDAESTYLQDIADYIRSEGLDSFNEAIRSEARSFYPDDLDAQRAYFAENGYFDDSVWEWESRERFAHYRELRTDASSSRQNAFYMTGLAVLNRAISAIDSAWMARRHNQGLTGEPTARLSVTPELEDGVLGSRATLEISF